MPKKKKKLTIKQKKFVKDVARTGNATQAAENNYNVTSRNSAQVIGSNLMALEHIKAAVKDELARMEPALTYWLKEALEAPIDDETGMTWETKRKFLETAAKLGQWGNQEKPEKDVTPAKIKRPN